MGIFINIAGLDGEDSVTSFRLILKDDTAMQQTADSQESNSAEKPEK